MLKIESAGFLLEQFRGDMCDPAYSARTIGEFTRIGFGIGDELWNRIGRNRRMYHHHQGATGQACDRRDIPQEIEIKIFVKRRIDGVGRTHQQQSVTVGRRAHDRISGDVASSSGPVLDDKLLAEPLRTPLPDQTRKDSLGRPRRTQP